MNVLPCKTIARLLTALLVFAPLLYATAQQTGPVSLQQLIDSATHHLPVLAQKQALINSADAQTKFVRNSFLPSAFVADELSVNTDNSLPGSYMSFGVIPSTSSGLRSTNNYQPSTGNIGILYSQYDLADFGYKKASVQNAQASVTLNRSDFARQQYQLAWQTGQLYFELMRAMYQLEVDKQNVQRYTDIYTVIHAVTYAGIRPGADSSLALAELSKTRIQYNQTAGRVAQLQQQLAYMTGINPASIRIDTTVTGDSATEKYRSAYGANINIATPGDSIAANPLTDYYLKQREVFESTENLVKKSYLPRLLLNGAAWGRGSSIDYTGDYKGLQTGLGYQRFNYMAGVTLQYDLTNPIHRRDKAAVAHYETEAGQAALDQQVQDLQNVNNKASTAIATAQQNLQEIPVQIGASQAAYNQKTAQYKAGLINLVDLTDASFVLYRAQTDYVQALSDWFMANLDKAASAGSLYPFIQTVK